MQKKPSLLLLLLNLVLRPAIEQTPPSSNHLPQQPPTDDREAWSVYWKEQGQPWRTEPEIDTKRQHELATHRAIIPDIQQGIYPFKGMKLERADVEWLLATHENGWGPVDWSDESQREREGLDMRGTDLSHQDLRSLPLARLCGGPIGKPWELSEKQRNMAVVNLKYTNLSETHLEGASLYGANLEKAFLDSAHLEKAILDHAHLEGVLSRGIHLEKAHLYHAHLEEAWLLDVHLEGAATYGSHFEKAQLTDAHLEGAILFNTHFEGAELHKAHFDSSTQLNNIMLENKAYGGSSLADTCWNDVNVTTVDWSSLTILGDERWACQKRWLSGEIKSKETQLSNYQTAVRAYRQLTILLQSQGLNEDAARFAYREEAAAPFSCPISCN